MPGWGLVKD